METTKSVLAMTIVAIGCGGVSKAQDDASMVCTASSCDDGISCTEDRCTNKACEFIPHDDICNTGYGCDAAMGCVPRYGLSQGRPGTSCADVLNVLVTASDGAYWIDPDGGAADNSFEVHCDMKTAGGGWTLVYKYVGTDRYSQIDILSRSFVGPSAPKAPLASERADAVHRRAFDAFSTAKGKSWMTKYMLYDGGDNHEIDRNFAIVDLDNATAWSNLYIFTPGCFALPGRATLRVFDEATRNLVTVGSSTFRYSQPPNAIGDGFGFLAADATQPIYDNMCGQAAGNYLTWPATLKFDVTLNLDWARVIPHMWYARQAANRNKDRCTWFCWDTELTYSGREWYVR
jgi:hypothetical protein